MSRGRVGIVVHETPIFNNGLIQNAYFLRVCLEASGHAVDFLQHEATVKSGTFSSHGLPVLPLNDSLDWRAYGLVVTATRLLEPAQFARFKAAGARVVNLICGNSLAYHLEEFAYGKHTGAFGCDATAHKRADAAWLIPCYRHFADYLQSINRIPVTIVPHLWSPEVIERAAAGAALQYDAGRHDSPQVELLVLEPNFNVTKTAVVPLVIAEHFNREYPHKLRHVHVFSYLEHEGATNIADSLQIKREGKLTLYQRLPVTDVLKMFANRGTKVVVLSHQRDNALNYVYYEALHYGFPLVHNSDMLGECGYRYSGNDVTGAVRAIIESSNQHFKRLKEYRGRARKFLTTVDPRDPAVAAAFNELVIGCLADAAPSPPDLQTPAEGSSPP